VQDFGFTTPSITEQAAQPPGATNQSQAGAGRPTETQETGKLDPPPFRSNKPSMEGEG
jgi:hypothetical protein